MMLNGDVPIFIDDMPRTETNKLVKAFPNREAVKVRKMYGGAKLEQPCAAWLAWNTSRCFDTDGAVIVGDLETQCFNYLVGSFRKMMMPKKMTQEEYDESLRIFEEHVGKENIRKSTS